jgi:transposase-like protein
MRNADLADLAAPLIDDDTARATLERLRWPDGVPTCPRSDCGVKGDSYQMRSAVGSSTRKGLWRCRACKRQFSVTVGTIFEDSHIPLGKWLTAIHLLCASKKGMSAHQLHRMLGVTYKSAWFLAHRIRYAMQRPPLVDRLRGVVEADETFIGGKPENMHVRQRMPAPPKTPVVALVERGGDVRSRVVADVTGKTLRTALQEEVDRSARLMTDGHPGYIAPGRQYAGHESVNHQEREYVRGNAHTNTVEGYFSILKRGIVGTYHHVSKQHLSRYLAEFDMRYNTRTSRGVDDAERMRRAVSGAAGKRLTYRPLVGR